MSEEDSGPGIGIDRVELEFGHSLQGGNFEQETSGELDGQLQHARLHLKLWWVRTIAHRAWAAAAVKPNRVVPFAHWLAKELGGDEFGFEKYAQFGGDSARASGQCAPEETLLAAQVAQSVKPVANESTKWSHSMNQGRELDFIAFKSYCIVCLAGQRLVGQIGEFVLLVKL